MNFLFLHLIVALVRFVFVACAATVSPTTAPTGFYIKTVAGTGTSASSGDNGPATSASFRHVWGMWSDTIGTLYLTETFGYKVRKIDSAGIITRFLGSGSLSLSGTEGPASSVGLDGAACIYGDTAGNIYLSSGAFFVWRYNASSGIVARYAGDLPALLGYSGDGGQATAARLSGPMGLFLSTNGMLYIADGLNNRIRRIDTSTGILTNFAGNGWFFYSGDNGQATSATFANPLDVWGNTAGIIFIADTFSHRIRQVNTSGIITTIAGTGYWIYNGDNIPATSSTIGTPYAIAGDTAGNLYLTDTLGCRMRKISSDRIMSTLVGTGSCSDLSTTTNASTVKYPSGLFVDSMTNIYFSEGYYIKELYIPRPTALPTLIPSYRPSDVPTSAMTLTQSVAPSHSPSAKSTTAPTTLISQSSTIPTFVPSLIPSVSQTMYPSIAPSVLPTVSFLPTSTPLAVLSAKPSPHPSEFQTVIPSVAPSIPSVSPSVAPTVAPTASPSEPPTVNPSTTVPSTFPSAGPTYTVGFISPEPTATPSLQPSYMIPSMNPSKVLTPSPSAAPSVNPSGLPSAPGPAASSVPSGLPTIYTTVKPSANPSKLPTAAPSQTPSVVATVLPTRPLTNPPNNEPSISPSVLPTMRSSSTVPMGYTTSPSFMPSVAVAAPTFHPTAAPTTARSTSTPTVSPAVVSVVTSSPSAIPSTPPGLNSASTSAPTNAHSFSPTTPSPTVSNVPNVPSLTTSPSSFRPNVFNVTNVLSPRKSKGSSDKKIFYASFFPAFFILLCIAPFLFYFCCFKNRVKISGKSNFYAYIPPRINKFCFHVIDVATTNKYGKLHPQASTSSLDLVLMKSV